MRTFLLAIGLIALAAPALAWPWSTTAQDGQQTPLPAATSDQTPSTPATPPESKPQGLSRRHRRSRRESARPRGWAELPSPEVTP